MDLLNRKVPIVKVFTPASFEGVLNVAILEEILHEDLQLDIRYTSFLDFRRYEEFKNVDSVIVLGLPYKGHLLSDEFFLEVNVPFMDFFHFSTYGEEISGEHLTSKICSYLAPIKYRYDLIIQDRSSTV